MRLLCFMAMTMMVVAAQVDDSDDEPLVVSKPVMKFILGCQKSEQEEEMIPVYRTDINADSGTTSQQVSLLAVDELQASLKAAIESDDVANRIMNRIKAEFGSPDKSFRQDCPVTNTINIDVPPEELEVFHTRMERVMQQNNNVLLGLINEMIGTKFSNLEKSLTALTNQRAEQLSAKLDQLLAQNQPSLVGPSSTTTAPEAAVKTADEEVTPQPTATEVPAVESSVNDKKQNSSGDDSFSEIVEAIQAANEQELLEKGTTTGAPDSRDDSGPKAQDHISQLSQLLKGGSPKVQPITSGDGSLSFSYSKQ